MYDISVVVFVVVRRFLYYFFSLLVIIGALVLVLRCVEHFGLYVYAFYIAGLMLLLYTRVYRVRIRYIFFKCGVPSRLLVVVPVTLALGPFFFQWNPFAAGCLWLCCKT